MTMEKVHDTIASYQKKIGSYDKQLWEQSVEQKVLKNIHHVPRRSVRMKTEFIDVDLVRGSTFSKAKPQVPWTYITQKAILRVVFFPFYYRWWIQQTCWPFWLLMLILYSLQLTTMTVYIVNAGEYLTQDNVTFTEMAVPALLMIILGLVHSQTVLAHYSHKPPGRDSVKLPRELSKTCRKRSKSRISFERESSTDARPAHCTERQAEQWNLKMKKDCSTKNKNKLDSKMMLSVNVESVPITGDSDSCSEELSRPSFLIKNKRLDKIPDRPLKSSVHGHSQYFNKMDETFRTEEKDADNQLEKLESSLNECKRDVSLLNKSNIGCSESETTYVDCVVESCLDRCKCSLTPCRQKHLISEQNDMVAASDLSATCLNRGQFLRRSRSLDGLSCSSSVHQVSFTGCSEQKSDTLAILLEQSKNTLSVGGFGKPMRVYNDRAGSDDRLCDSAHQFCSTSLLLVDKPVQVNSESQLRNRKSFRNENKLTTSRFFSRRAVPNSLLVHPSTLKESNGLSSSEGENETNTPDYRKSVMSSEEWEDQIHSDVATSTSDSSGCATEGDISGGRKQLYLDDAQQHGWTVSNINVINLLQPPGTTTVGHSHIPPPDKGLSFSSPVTMLDGAGSLDLFNFYSVSCVIWEGNECKKVDLTALDIGWVIIDKVDNIPESSDYILIGLFFSIIMGFVPPLFRAFHTKELFTISSFEGLINATTLITNNSWKLNLIVFNGVIQRVCLSVIFFFLLSVADRTFKQRLLYAKHFCYLTSSRRARKFDMPHFRLNKVRNIKTWLSLRSYLKKRGPQRSVDVIVSSSFLLAIMSVSLMCLQLLKDTETYLDYLGNWELLVWSLALGVYILHFMTVGLKINKKYRNLSVLITEQINLYLQMEQKPHKKDDLMLANNVLKLAEDLLKELESPFKISGLSANPFLYNVTKVVVLSAFSAVLTELLGFKLKLYKIKFRT